MLRGCDAHSRRDGISADVRAKLKGETQLFLRVRNRGGSGGLTGGGGMCCARRRSALVGRLYGARTKKPAGVEGGGKPSAGYRGQDRIITWRPRRHVGTLTRHTSTRVQVGQ